MLSQSEEKRVNTRNRYPEFIIPHRGIAKILKNAGPRLQIQFNDENNKCIGKSWVLKPEVKIVDKGTLFQTKFIPITTNANDLIVPSNAKSIVIFGQQGRFTNCKSALNKLVKKEYDFNNYTPTTGIEISGPMYLITPMRLVLTGYDLDSNEYSVDPYNDIVKSFTIEDNKFKSLETIEPLVIVDSKY